MLGEVTVEFRVDMSLLVFLVDIQLCHIDPFRGLHYPPLWLFT